METFGKLLESKLQLSSVSCLVLWEDTIMAPYCNVKVGNHREQWRECNFYIEDVFNKVLDHDSNFQGFSCIWQSKLPCLHSSQYGDETIVSYQSRNIDISMYS